VERNGPLNGHDPYPVGSWADLACDWTGRLVRVYSGAPVHDRTPADYFHGEGFKDFNLALKVENEYRFWKVIYHLKRTDPDLIYRMFNDPPTEDGLTLPPRIRKLLLSIRDINDLPDMKFREFISPVFDRRNVDFQRRYLMGLLEYEKRLERIDRSSVKRVDNRVKAMINFNGLYLMSGVDSFVEPTARAIYALSYLHPIADSFMDVEGGSDLVRYEDRLTDPKVNPETGRERVLDRILTDIEGVYPRQDHPALYDLMTNLHQAQVRSRMQKQGMDPEEMLFISFLKGGWSMALYGYIATGELTGPQFRWLMQIGSLQQLLDDVIDVQEDLISGTSTAFTRALAEEGTLDLALYRMSHLERYLRRELGDYPSGRRAVRVNVTHAFFDQKRLKLIALYLHTSRFSGGFQREFRKRRPCSLTAFRTIWGLLEGFTLYMTRRTKGGGRVTIPPRAA